MAEIEEGFVAYLKAYAGLTALTSTRIYPDEIPQGVTTLPCVIYFLVSDVKDHYLTAQCTLERPIYQFTVVASTKTSAKAVAAQIKAALNDYTGSMSSVSIQKIELQNEMHSIDTSSDGTTRVFTIDLEYEINYIRA